MTATTAMTLPVVQLDGKKSKIDSIEVNEVIFNRPFQEELVHQVLTAYRAAGRTGSKQNKNRSDVRGGGAKPRRQKGGGCSRMGTSRSPIAIGGGVTFAARPRDFSQKVNRKMHRAAMQCIVAEHLRRKQWIVVDDLALKSSKTRDLLTLIQPQGLERALFVDLDIDESFYYASRNLPNLWLTDVIGLDVLSLYKAPRVVITLEALKVLEERIGQ